MERKFETPRLRTFTINLTNEEVRRLYIKAGTVNLTPAELLENFINDLILSDRSNGSDERDCAESWFDRCGFSYDRNETFLAYLLNECAYDYFLKLHKEIEDDREEITELLEDENFSNEERDSEIDFYRSYIKKNEDEIREMFADYQEYNKTPDSYEEEVKKVFDYRDSLERSLGEIYEQEES